MSTRPDPFGAHAVASFAGVATRYARLAALEEQGLVELARLPYSLRVLLENVLRHCGNGLVDRDDVLAVAQWRPQPDGGGREIAFMPSRVVLQDFTGVPCVVDLAAMRSAVARVGADPTIINPSVPVDLVIDHSVQVDCWGSDDAYDCNVAFEMQRNAERYTLLRWAQNEFSNFRLVPPGTGIVHQVNLEYLASVVHRRAAGPAGGGGGATAGPGGAGLDAGASDRDGRRHRGLGVPRYRDRHRLAHHDDQRPGSAGLGSRRHRGRGGHAGAAVLHAGARGRRGAVDRSARARARPPPTWC